MLHLRYLAGFWICFDFRIYQSSEYTWFLNMSGLHKVSNKIFRDRFMDSWQYSEYATVLNMLGSHKVVNKIFHDKHLTGFWICLQFWKYQCYAGFCRKQPVIYVWQASEYSLGSQPCRVWIYMVVNMPRLHMVLHKLYFKDSYYFECLEFWIC